MSGEVGKFRMGWSRQGLGAVGRGLEKGGFGEREGSGVGEREVGERLHP